MIAIFFFRFTFRTDDKNSNKKIGWESGVSQKDKNGVEWNEHAQD